ncbi:hypothetical protein N6H14_09935 [Paenibacillus sp. CC-CFT747]|nr:hypothetical protein N6H14_09935 [Paenibacillus sp. CC-CFT747]
MQKTGLVNVDSVSFGGAGEGGHNIRTASPQDHHMLLVRWEKFNQEEEHSMAYRLSLKKKYIGSSACYGGRFLDRRDHGDAAAGGLPADSG